MTLLTALLPEYSYGDLLTTTNSGHGLTTTLNLLQDGLGNNSTVTIATNAINFNRTGGNTFQLDSIPLLATSTNINSVCQPNPILPGNGSVQIPIGSTAQRTSPAVEGDMRYNTNLLSFEGYKNGAWTSFSTGGIESISGTANQINVTGGPNVIISLNSHISLDSITTKQILFLSPDTLSTSGWKAQNGSNDTVWQLPTIDGEDGNVLTTNGEGATRFSTVNANIVVITQAAHGFIGDEVVRLNSLTFILAQADNIVNAEVVGVVERAIDANTFYLLVGGYLTDAFFFGLLTPGSVYFLSPTIPGAVTTTAPTASGQVVKPLFVASSTSDGIWLNQRGNLIP